MTAHLEELARLPLTFRKKVIVALNGCWLWQAYINEKGYPRYRQPGGNQRNAFRYAYEQLIGPVPDGFNLDHFVEGCDKCANPWHTEPITEGDNIRRFRSSVTHCPRGHLYAETLEYNSPGRMRCGVCYVERHAEYKAALEVRGDI